MSGTGGLISLYDAENRPTHLSRISGTEDATDDADGERHIARLDDAESCPCETSHDIL
jgi:hypothetical protein